MSEDTYWKHEMLTICIGKTNYMCRGSMHTCPTNHVQLATPHMYHARLAEAHVGKIFYDDDAF